MCVLSMLSMSLIFSEILACREECRCKCKSTLAGTQFGQSNTRFQLHHTHTHLCQHTHQGCVLPSSCCCIPSCEPAPGCTVASSGCTKCCCCCCHSCCCCCCHCVCSTCSTGGAPAMATQLTGAACSSGSSCSRLTAACTCSRVFVEWTSYKSGV